LSTEVTKFE